MEGTVKPDLNPICPKCKQGDQVQKVTNLYDVNTKEWSEEELGMDVFGHVEDRTVQHEAHTKLGHKLKPPEEPDPPSHPGLWYWIGIIAAALLLASICSFVVVPLAIFIPILLSNSSSLPAVFRGSSGTILTIVIVLTVLVIGLIVLGLLVWLGIVIKRRYDRDMLKYRDQKEAYEVEMQHYQSAKERWTRLYYCMRDAIVFIPTENKAIPVEDMGRYLKDPYYKY